MADGWSRSTGRPGVATVHQGPGLTNTLTALAEAAKAHTPLVVLAGDTPPRALRSNFRPADLAPVAAWAAEPRGPLLLDAKVDPRIAGDWLAEAFRGG